MIGKDIPFIFSKGHISSPSFVGIISILKPVSTPIQHRLILTLSQAPKTTAEWEQMHDIPYREAVGSLMYAVLRTHPDIAFVKLRGGGV